MSDMELLKQCIDQLDGIHVPVKQLSEIAVPIYNVSVALKQLREVVLNRSKEKQEEKVEPEDVPNEEEPETEQ